MKDHVKKRLLRTLVLSVVALIIGVGVGWFQVQMRNSVVLKDGASQAKGMQIAGLQVGGAFTLNDHNGDKFTQENFAGQYNLIYFGFTYCPAICPTELQKVSRVMNGLEKEHPELAAQMQPVFVTIDPERDTTAVMKDYISLFHKRLIGLTGTLPQIDHMKTIYRVFGRKVFDEGSTEYTIDHSSYIYLMSPEGALISMYRTKDKADYIYQDMKERLL
jgi:cytochrome oxidase Cu insertion factor (SCO1/SenC/PrrC family)